VVESGKDQFDKEINASKFDRHRDRADEEEEEEEGNQDKFRAKQQQSKQDMGQTSDVNRGTSFQHKVNTHESNLNIKMNEVEKGAKTLPARGEEATLTSGDNQILTEQSDTGDDKCMSEDIFQHKVAKILNLQVETLEQHEKMQIQGETTVTNENNQSEEASINKENEQPLRSDEMEEELLDYGDDYEPIEQEKA
jgi:hypothetical protein